MRQAIVNELRPHFHGSHSRIALLGAPSHGNLGDNILHLATLEVAALFGKSLAVTCSMRVTSAWPSCPPAAQLLDTLGPNPLILLQAGGNWGDIWQVEQKPRLKYLKQLDMELGARNATARVVQLAQSLHYINSQAREHDAAQLADLRNINLTLYARQVSSLAHAPPASLHLVVRLMPDMAFLLSPVSVLKAEVDILLILRKDKESIIGMTHANISAMANTMFAPWNITYKVRDWVASDHPRPGELEVASPGGFSLIRWHAATTLVGSAKVVITDRLHASIVALLTDRHHIMIDNSYGKLGGVRDLAFNADATCDSETLREHRVDNVWSALDLARTLLASPRMTLS